MSLPNSNSLAIKATLLFTSTLTVMSGATIAPSLPAMQEYFADVPNSALLVRLVLTIPALFIAIGGLFVGQLADRLGRKPLLIGSTALRNLSKVVYSDRGSTNCLALGFFSRFKPRPSAVSCPRASIRVEPTLFVIKDS